MIFSGKTGPLFCGLSTALAMFVAALLPLPAKAAKPSQGPPWYVTAAAIHRVTLKPTTRYWRFEHLSMNPATAKQQMLTWKNEGITALEIFAPEEGGNSYDGLDAKDRFRLDPGLGSIGDFRRLVRQAHSLGLSRRDISESWIQQCRSAAISKSRGRCACRARHTRKKLFLLEQNKRCASAGNEQ